MPVGCITVEVYKSARVAKSGILWSEVRCKDRPLLRKRSHPNLNPRCLRHVNLASRLHYAAGTVVMTLPSPSNRSIRLWWCCIVRWKIVYIKHRQQDTIRTLSPQLPIDIPLTWKLCWGIGDLSHSGKQISSLWFSGPKGIRKVCWRIL